MTGRIKYPPRKPRRSDKWGPPKLAGRTPDWILEKEGLIPPRERTTPKPSLRRWWRRNWPIVLMVGGYFGFILFTLVSSL